MTKYFWQLEKWIRINSVVILPISMFISIQKKNKPVNVILSARYRLCFWKVICTMEDYYKRLIIMQTLLFLVLTEEYIPKQILVTNLGITKSNYISYSFWSATQSIKRPSVLKCVLIFWFRWHKSKRCLWIDMKLSVFGNVWFCG